jgi:hypothetical protein
MDIISEKWQTKQQETRFQFHSRSKSQIEKGVEECFQEQLHLFMASVSKTESATKNNTLE